MSDPKGYCGALRFSETLWFPCQGTSKIICPFTWFQFGLLQSVFQVRISMSGSWTLHGKALPWLFQETKSLEEWQGTACHTVTPHQDPENHRTSWPSTAGSISSRWQGQLTTHHTMVNHCCECSVEECDTGVSRSLGCQEDQELWGKLPTTSPFHPLSFQKSNCISATWIRTDSRTYNTSQAGQVEDIKQTAGAKRWTHIKPSTISTVKQNRWCLVIIIVITSEIYATLMFKNIFSLFFLLSWGSRQSN